MVKVYGGLLLRNLLAGERDKCFNFQMELFDKGFIDGVQLLLEHPSFTPKADIVVVKKAIGNLPEGFGLFIHYASENRGVDLGQNLDEEGVYAREGKVKGMSWNEWNLETLRWGIKVAKIASSRIIPGNPLGVIHPGYGKSENDFIARKEIIETLKKFDGRTIALENVPPVISKKFQEEADKRKRNWGRELYWGFGGTPEDMKNLLSELGKDWKCFIDFTHLVVAANQAEMPIGSNIPFYSCLVDIESLTENYLHLPHATICHFAGSPGPSVFVDDHSFYKNSIPKPVKYAIQQMDAVCLEFPWNPNRSDLAKEMIETFRNQIK